MKPNLQVKRNHIIIISLILILLVAGFLRIFELKTVPPGLYPDEAMNGNNALEAIATGEYKVFYPENNGREGFFINIQALVLKYIFGVPEKNQPEPWMLRLVSAIFGVLTVLGVYFLTRELFRENSKHEARNSKPRFYRGSSTESGQIQNSNTQTANSFRISDFGFRISHSEKVALLTSFFLAVSFWHINFSRIGFRAIMAPAFLVWGIYLLLVSFRKSGGHETNKLENSKSEARNSKPRFYRGSSTESGQIQNSNTQIPKQFRISNFEFRISIPAILAGMVYGLGMHSYIAYRATPLLIIFILWLFTFKYGWGAVLKIGSFFIIGAIITSLPLINYFVGNPQDFFGRTTQVSVLSSENALLELGLNITKTIGMFFVAGDYNWRHNIAGEPQLFWPVAVFFGIGIVVGIKEIFVKNPKHKTRNSKQYQNSPPPPEVDPLSEEKTERPMVKNDQNLKHFKLLNFENSNLFRISDFGFRILLMWLIVTALPVIISNEGIPHALRAILMIPPIFILSAIGAYKLYNLSKKYLSSKLLFAICYLLFAVLIAQSFRSYFIKWGQNEETGGAFNKNYVEIGKELNVLPIELSKYIIVEAGGVNVRGLPMSTQTVMFVTNTFTPEKQKEKNIFYILPNEKEKIPKGVFIVELK